MQRVKLTLRKHFRLKFGTKLNLCLILCALVPAVTTVLFFYGRLMNNTIATTLQSRQSTLSSIEVSIENQISSVWGILDAVYNDSRLLRLLESSPAELEQAYAQADSTLTRTAQLFQSATEAYLKKDVVSTIKIYAEDAELLNSLCAPSEDAVFAPIEEIQYSYWKGLMEITGEDSHIFPGYYLMDDEREQNGNTACVQKLTYYRGNVKKTAYLSVYFLDSQIQEILSDSVSDKSEMYYLVDSNDYMVTLSANIASNFGLYMQDYAKWEEEFADDHEFHLKDFGQGEEYVTAFSLRGTQWMVVWIIPKSSIIGASAAILKNFLFLYALLLLGIFVLVLWIVHQLLGRLTRLTQHMNALQDEFPAEYTEDPGSDEIGELIIAYNYMIRQNNRLHRQELEDVHERNQLKMEALRSQIDPHFLYNTLDMIRWLSVNGRQSDVEKAIQHLSRFYRLTTNKGNPLIPVRGELEHVGLYMELMNMRFQNRINYVIDVPEEMMDFMIPVLIFQPIVENAISHGIFEKESQSGCISITGWMDEEFLYFEIADDGVGMTEEQLSRILTEQTSNRPGIGVFHTRRRLQILYQNKADLVYHSTVGSGTEAEYRIPLSIPALEEEIV